MSNSSWTRSTWTHKSLDMDPSATSLPVTQLKVLGPFCATSPKSSELTSRNKQERYLEIQPGVDLLDDLVNQSIDPANKNADIPKLYRCVCAGMIGKIIEGSLDNASLKTLILEKKSFARQIQPPDPLITTGQRCFKSSLKGLIQQLVLEYPISKRPSKMPSSQFSQTL